VASSERPAAAGPRWTFAAQTADIGQGGLLGVVCGGRSIALCRLSDGYVALLDQCPHLGARLSEGCLVDGFVECPLHYGLFDAKTGASAGGVTMHSAQTFPARVVNGAIEVDLEPADSRGED